MLSSKGLSLRLGLVISLPPLILINSIWDSVSECLFLRGGPSQRERRSLLTSLPKTLWPVKTQISTNMYFWKLLYLRISSKYFGGETGFGLSSEFH